MQRYTVRLYHFLHQHKYFYFVLLYFLFAEELCLRRSKRILFEVENCGERLQHHSCDVVQ